MGRGLSADQQDLLCDLLEWYQHVEAKGNEFAKTDLSLRGLSIPWLRGTLKDWSRSESASFSRSLRRLEQRGLILRINVNQGIPEGHPQAGRIRTSIDQPCTRADHVLLTPLGRQVAGQLSVNKNRTNFVNR
jgi:hypothetical protein